MTEHTPRLALIVARAKGGVIGREGAMPWRQSTDLKHFKAATLGKPVMMGRKTWASLGRALPGRANLVLTRNVGFQAAGAQVFTDFNAMLARGRAIAAADGVEEAMIIGGGELYALTLPLADRLYITEIDADLAGDARFPAFDETAWRETAARPVPAGPKDEHPAVIRVLERR